jgi:hypothetical protein
MEATQATVHNSALLLLLLLCLSLRDMASVCAFIRCGLFPNRVMATYFVRHSFTENTIST